METTEKERIEKVMQAEGLNATQFASEIGIKTPTLSHILSGRNNRSVDVLKKILDRYRTINSDWLILGIGQMYRDSKKSQTPTLFENMDEIDTKSAGYGRNIVEKNVTEESISYIKPIADSSQTIKIPPVTTDKSKFIKKIIVYYDDNTFQEFEAK